MEAEMSASTQTIPNLLRMTREPIVRSFDSKTKQIFHHIYRAHVNSVIYFFPNSFLFFF
jgi:hypothetical protein